MTARFVALLFTAVSLAACGTTAPTTTASGDAAPQPAADTPSRMVVRGPIVPDDEPAPQPARKTVKPSKRVVMADAASAPVEAPAPVAEKPAEQPAAAAPAPEPRKPQPSDLLAAPSSGGVSGGGSPGGGSTAGGGSSGTPEAAAPSVTPAPFTAEPPATISAEPTGAPAAPAPAPAPFAIDFRDMLTTSVAGFPLWQMIAAAVVLAAVLVFGLGARRSRSQPRQEPVREDRVYVDRDEEAVPA